MVQLLHGLHVDSGVTTRLSETNSHTTEISIKGLDAWYCTTYMSQTRDQRRFTISEVTADWHEPMHAAAHYVAIHCLRQRTSGPTVQLADTPSPQSATLGLHP